MKPGLGLFGIKLSFKKIVSAVATAVGTAIGGPLGGLIANKATDLIWDAFDGGGWNWGRSGMNAPTVDKDEFVKKWAENEFSPWFENLSKVLKNSAIKSIVLSAEYRNKVNYVLKMLESYRIYFQIRRSQQLEINWEGLGDPGQIQASNVLKKNDWKTKEDVINIFKKAVYDSYIDVLKTHGVTAYAQLVNFTAPKGDQNKFPEPFVWDKSNDYTSELLVFTSSSDGNPAEYLYETETTGGGKGETSGGFPKSPVLIDSVKQTVGEKPTTGDPVNTNPTTTQNPTENNQTGTPKTETENNKIFGLPKPLAYLIGGATIWKVLSN